jgi:hypothetical protein
MSHLKNSLNINIFLKKFKKTQNFIILKFNKKDKSFKKSQLFTKILLNELNFLKSFNIKMIKFPLNIIYFSFLDKLLSFCLINKNFIFFIRFKNFICFKIYNKFLLKLKFLKFSVFSTFFQPFLPFFLLTKKYNLSFI